MGFLDSLTSNHVFKVELLMITGVVLLTLYILYQLKVFPKKK